MKRTFKFVIATVLAAGVTASAVSSPVLAHGKGKGGERRLPMSFEQLDADGNGTVSAEEFKATRLAKFKAADTDGNGALSAEEMLAAREKTASKTPKADRATRMIERLDTNEDGELSMDELTARRSPEKMFERIDANSDGAISEEEFAEAQAKLAKRMGKHNKGH